MPSKPKPQTAPKPAKNASAVEAPIGLTDAPPRDVASDEKNGPVPASEGPEATREPAAVADASAGPNSVPPADAAKTPPRQDAAPECPACPGTLMTAYHSSPVKTFYRCPKCRRTDQRMRPSALAALTRRGPTALQRFGRDR